jgi:mannosylglycerate hydrolase
MRTLHVVSHTHWDREWYRPFQSFRLRLVHLIDDLLKLLEQDKNFKFFMLDGQTIVLDDYLAIRPENEKILRDHIRKGRVIIGPWHILPDMFLVSPEAHIRNLLEGDRTAHKFGPKMMIGYMPDSFGHFAQMPQLICGFGMDVISLWRGPDDQPAEFWWDAPDGSRVLMAYLRDSYSNGASLQPAVPSEFAAQLAHAANSLAAHSAVSDYLIMFGNDHMEPPRETSKAIAYSNAALRNAKVLHSTLPNYVKAIKTQIAKSKVELPVYSGEFRSSKHSHLLPGVLSTRMWIKQRNQACETLLEKWVEPFSTFASLAGSDLQTMNHDPSPIIHHAWRLLMECHPHDSICGCSIDQVHEEMKPRFDQVEQIGEEIIRQSLESLAVSVQTKSEGARASIIVFNPSSFRRTDVVNVELSLPNDIQDFEILDQDGTMIAYQSTSGKVSDLINVSVRRDELGGLLSMVHEGRAGNLAIQDIHFERDQDILHVEAIFAEDANPKIEVWDSNLKLLQDFLKDASLETFHIHARSPEFSNVTFTAADVPALGWKTFYIQAKENKPTEIRVSPWMRWLAPLASSPIAQKFLARLTQPSSRPPYRIENDFFVVEANQDGTLSITDKRDGSTYRGLNRFVDGGDCGDEYNFCSPHSDAQVVAQLKSVNVIKGDVLQTLELNLELQTPAELSSDRKSRSKRMVSIPIIARVILIPGVPRIDIQTAVDNRAKDHRLRVHFRAPFKTDSGDYDSHFEIRNRKIGLPAFDETWMEQPRPEVPQRAFTDVSDGRHGLMIANRGLPEAEVLNFAKTGSLHKVDETEIALTLLRCVGWLSRDDFPARKGHAGPFLETPAAQMPGAWTFDYSIIPHSGSWDAAFQQAYAFETPLRGISMDIHAGTLPATGSFIETSPSTFIISAIKESEDGRGWIVRGVNLKDEAVQVRIKLWRKFKTMEQVNLAEQKIGTLKFTPDGNVTMEARGHEIVTVLLRS